MKQLRYNIHFYCLVVEAGFYSDVVECRTLNQVDRVQSSYIEIAPVVSDKKIFKVFYVDTCI